jgi:competence protein ComEC
LLIDSLAVYQVKTFQPKKILLTESPKVNLERLIKAIDPQEIIADNSNFKTYVNRWRQTCSKYEIPFYYTNEKGAYLLNN